MDKTIIVGSIITQNNKILMVCENEDKYKGMWSLPTGHHNMNESIFEGIIRETKEETGLTVTIDGLLPIYITKTKIIIRATTRIIDGNIKADGKEIREVKYMTIEEILSLPEEELRGYKFARMALMDYLNNKISNIDVSKQILEIEKQKIYRL